MAATQATEIKPMSFLWAKLGDAEELAQDPSWVFEQKCDGMRLMTTVADGEVNFNLISTTAAQWFPALREAFRGLEGEWVLDGELMTATGEYVLFDMPWAPNAAVAPRMPLARRRAALQANLAVWKAEWPGAMADVRLVTQAETCSAKMDLLRTVRDMGAEGVVAKRLDSQYRVDGQRSPEWLKLKFTKTVDCVVVARDQGAKNARLAVYNEAGELQEIGTCSMIGKEDAQVGQVVEVKYLYATPYNVLYQPTMLRIREDKAPEDCKLAQLVPVNRTIL